MANSCSTDHNCKFNNNIVLMFQDINVAKSAPFALLTISQKSMYSPKVFKRPPFWQITRNLPTISLIWTTRSGNPKFHSKLHEIRSIRQSPQRTMHEIRMRLSQISTIPCSLSVPQFFLQQISQNPHNSLILGANHA